MYGKKEKALCAFPFLPNNLSAGIINVKDLLPIIAVVSTRREPGGRKLLPP